MPLGRPSHLSVPHVSAPALCTLQEAEWLGASAVAQRMLMQMSRLRLNVERMRDKIETTMRKYSTPTVRPRRKLYMSRMVDAIASV